jgi:hypothetical protein
MELFDQGGYFTNCKEYWQGVSSETSEMGGRARRGYLAGSRKTEDKALIWDVGLRIGNGTGHGAWR